MNAQLRDITIQFRGITIYSVDAHTCMHTRVYIYRYIYIYIYIYTYVLQFRGILKQGGRHNSILAYDNTGLGNQHEFFATASSD